MIFSNARLVLPAGIQDGFELVVGEGKIAEIRPQSGAASIDLAGSFLAPGFIDMHVHGALGRDTMEASSDAFRAICDYHASGGTTSLLLTTATAPVQEIVDVLRAVRSSIKTVPQVAGVHVEGPFISKQRAGAQRTEFIRDPEPHLVDELLKFADVIKIMTVAPELPGALSLIDRLGMHKIVASGGHSDASDVE
ncbi:MAG: amidohydrolase family protein, partial [Chthoniobacterales bacterium]